MATVVALSLAALVGHQWWEGRFRGEAIDIERSAPQDIVFQIDINQADWPEFTLLPDVGEQLAKRIVTWRDEHGPFHDHGDLRRVRGIGPKTFDRIRPYLLPLPDAENVAGSRAVQPGES
jgi:competence protein ComEA